MSINPSELKVKISDHELSNIDKDYKEYTKLKLTTHGGTLYAYVKNDNGRLPGRINEITQIITDKLKSMKASQLHAGEIEFTLPKTDAHPLIKRTGSAASNLMPNHRLSSSSEDSDLSLSVSSEGDVDAQEKTNANIKIISESQHRAKKMSQRISRVLHDNKSEISEPTINLLQEFSGTLSTFSKMDPAKTKISIPYAAKLSEKIEELGHVLDNISIRNVKNFSHDARAEGKIFAEERFFLDAQQQAKELVKKIKDTIKKRVVKMPDEAWNLRNDLLTALDNFSKIAASSSIPIHLTLRLTQKIDEFTKNVELLINSPGQEIKNLDLKLLDLKKCVDEVRMISTIKKDSLPLEVLTGDEARASWKQGLGNLYFVRFDEFYQKVILQIFPDEKGDNKFKEFISDLINFSKDEDITAHTWSLFLGPYSTDEFKKIILENKDHPNFIREYQDYALRD